ncbi:helix-turn-helix transcriptional regulator [Bacillus infantis]|uniref:helix-turn-helix transcriptional regulator n=1 Tax=Bacillus infantis TaxID=324767 RepID=UPI00344B342A
MYCKLKEILKEQGRKQSWLCSEVGISDTAMSQICNNKSEPKLKVALKISKAVGVPVEEIWLEPAPEEN